MSSIQDPVPRPGVQRFSCEIRRTRREAAGPEIGPEPGKAHVQGYGADAARRPAGV
jgi:hypothetical protein